MRFVSRPLDGAIAWRSQTGRAFRIGLLQLRATDWRLSLWSHKTAAPPSPDRLRIRSAWNTGIQSSRRPTAIGSVERHDIHRSLPRKFELLAARVAVIYLRSFKHTPATAAWSSLSSMRCSGHGYYNGTSLFGHFDGLTTRKLLVMAGMNSGHRRSWAPCSIIPATRVRGLLFVPKGDRSGSLSYRRPPSGIIAVLSTIL